MKRTLIALSLLAVAASLYGDSITLNQGIATDNNNARVHLNAVKNADGSYTLSSSPTTVSGDASAANQTAVQANPGSDSTKAVGVQGVTGGKAVPVEQAASTSTTAATPTQGAKTVAAAGTPVQLTSSSTKVESVEIYARKNDTTANTGVILLGVSSTGGQNHRPIPADTAIVISAPSGKKVDLSTIYIDAATTGDGVVWTAVN